MEDYSRDVELGTPVAIVYRVMFQKERTVYGVVSSKLGQKQYVVKTTTGLDIVNKDGTVPWFGNSYWYVRND
jgi:hypothetical protein